MPAHHDENRLAQTTERALQQISRLDGTLAQFDLRQRALNASTARSTRSLLQTLARVDSRARRLAAIIESIRNIGSPSRRPSDSGFDFLLSTRQTPAETPPIARSTEQIAGLLARVVGQGYDN